MRAALRPVELGWQVPRALGRAVDGGLRLGSAHPPEQA